MKYTFKREDLDSGIEMCTVDAVGFKTAAVSVNFVMPLSEKASLYALIPNILTRSSEEYPTLTDIEKKLSMLYGAEITADVSKSGEHQVIKLAISCLDDRFSLGGEKIITDCCDMLFSLVFKPKLINGEFCDDETQSEKRLLTEQLEAQKSDKRVYAKNRCEEIMCADEAYGINRYGTVESIESITPAALTKAYREVLCGARITLCVSGSADFEAIKKAFCEYTEKIERDVIESETVFVEEADDVTYVKEKEDVKQGKLVMGFRMGMTASKDKYAERRVMTDVFGGSPSSKLFTVVREKMSLCYYCSARMVGGKGVMFVQSGIESYNEEKAKKGILDQLEALKNGDFTDDELDASIKALEDGFKSVSDSPDMLDAWFMSQITDDEYLYPEDYIAMFKKVTRDDVIAAARDVTLDTVFMLEGNDSVPNDEED